MSVVDDLKNSLGSSSNSSNRSKSQSRQSSKGFDDTGFSDSDLGSRNNPGSLDRGKNTGNASQARQRQNQSSSGDFNRHGNDQPSRNPDRNHNSPQNGLNDVNRQQGNSDIPNAQAGRPQQGSSRPQVSSQTQRKMENAGFRSDSQNNTRNQQPVADRRNDFEELRSQNEQIIELLKRINRNLEQLGR